MYGETEWDGVERRGPERRQDAEGLTFSLRLVLTIIVAVMAAWGGAWAVTYSVRSDIRDISTRQQMQIQIQHERDDNIKEAIDSMRRRQELQQYEIQSMKEMMMKGKGKS